MPVKARLLGPQPHALLHHLERGARRRHGAADRRTVDRQAGERDRPTFEGGLKLPVLASFRTRVGGILGVTANVSSTFAGGDAAETMTKLFDDPYVAGTTIPLDSTRCISTRPSPKLFGQDIVMPGPGEVRPFVFGTDTTFGLKVAWSGVVGAVAAAAGRPPPRGARCTPVPVCSCRSSRLHVDSRPLLD